MPIDATLARPGGLSYLEIAARDPARSAAFYTRVLGWRVEKRGPADFRFTDAGGALIGAFRSDLIPGGGPFVPFFYVVGIREASERAEEAGGEVVEGVRPEGDLWVARVFTLSR